MNWKKIKLIFGREMRDQLRDRRTLFMIAVLPLFFYPLLGLTFFHIAQFLEKHTSKVLVVGYETVSGIPDLIKDGHLAPGILDSEDAKLVEVVMIRRDSLAIFRREKMPTHDKIEKELLLEMHHQDCEAVFYFPPKFFTHLREHPEALKKFAKSGDAADMPEKSRLEIYQGPISENAAIARTRVLKAAQNWSTDVGNAALDKANIPKAARDPITWKAKALAKKDRDRLNASLWSKILPFVLLIWAVTGAFYPAIDLCAGEKERGTLETLLTSPARRSEIVMGKLLTVMMFSIATALLNMVSMGATGYIVLSQLPALAKQANVGPPPLLSFVWLGFVLLPVAALISAVCLALSAFAKSTKEGQYYLMPVILVTLPLMLVPMYPAIELNLPLSLIPITGVVLLMRSLMEGTFVELWGYAFPVAFVTFGCIWLAVRWAVEQFSSENVLFREGERFTAGTWVRQLIRDRQPTPTVAMALLCGFVILVINFFLGAMVDMPTTLAEIARMTFGDLAQVLVVTQLAVILTPALLMAVMLTSSPRRALSLKSPFPPLGVVAAVLMAVVLLPVGIALLQGLGQIFAPNEEIQIVSQGLMAAFDRAPHVLLALALIALLPAVCEELAFRGFILSGMRHSGHKWRAIIIASLFFALIHPLWHQQVNAFFLGLVIGFIAVQTGSIWPAIAYHLVHNSAMYLGHRWGLLEDIEGNMIYLCVAAFVGAVCAIPLLLYFRQLPYQRTKEEQLTETIEQERAHSLAS